MHRRRIGSVVLALVGVSLAMATLARGDGPEGRLELDEATRARCLAVLRAGLSGEEFWPSMHAAEGLTVAGFGNEVRARLAPRLSMMLPEESDDQQRCGLARELVRAGDLSFVRVMLDVLASPNPYGHVHACESLYKVWQLGDGVLIRRAFDKGEPIKLKQMAAAALARWGSASALEWLGTSVRSRDAETARTAAWILARMGDRGDLPALRAGAKRFEDPLTRAYFEHALAALGDDEGRRALVRNLAHADPMVRVYAAEFAPEARPVEARGPLLRLLDDPALDVRIRAAQALLQLSRPEPEPDPVADIRRDVFVATPENPRYSEGSIVVLADGRLLYATTEFEGSGSDFASARIVAVNSADEGRSWGERRVLQENVGEQNVMSATLRRLAGPGRFDGPIGFFYLVKNSKSDLQVFLRVSDDDGKTFGAPVRVTDRPGYHVMNNDRVLVHSLGRLFVPVASTDDVGRRGSTFSSSCYYSDDLGRTWRRSRDEVTYPKRGAMEPEVLERPDGGLLMHFRTQLGHIAVSHSARDDAGATWSKPEPWGVRAPEAPATLRRIPSTGHLLLIWNDTFRADANHGGKRTPLTAAISTDEGRTWTHRRDLETSTAHSYAYTSVAFHRGRALLTYYVRDEPNGRISSRFRSLPIAWFYQGD